VDSSEWRPRETDWRSDDSDNDNDDDYDDESTMNTARPLLHSRELQLICFTGAQHAAESAPAAHSA
jgi:hypothetical protein